MHVSNAPHDCGRTLDRRAFLRQATGFAGAVLVGLGAPSAATEAMVRELHASEATTSSAGARLRKYAMPAVDGALVDAENEVLLVRWAGRVHAFSMSCPHRGATLRWQGTASGAFCPKHKARFSPAGENVGGRRTRALDRFPIRREETSVVVDVTVPLEQDADAVAWEAAWVSA